MSGFVPFDDTLAQAGLIEPEVVEVPDGFYTHRCVIDTPLHARALTGDEMPVLVDYHLEPLDPPQPRFREEIMWRPWRP